MVKFAQLPKYEACKDSGVEWLGEIPKYWNVRKLKYLLKEVNHRSEDGKENLLSVSQYTGVTLRSNKLSEGDLLTNAESLEGYKIVKVNDLVSNIMLAWNGSLGFSNYDGIVSPAYAVYRLNAGLDQQFFHYLLRTDLYKAEYKRQSTGVIESRLRLYTDSFYDIFGLLPSAVEQTLIANFLDQKTAQIDAAIAIKEQQIELLKERKQIIIQQAVTQGLDPNVPMKDSGVEWIGQIPEHWEVKKLKHGLLLTNDKIESKKSQLKYLGMESVQAATGLLSGVDSEADGLANVFHSGQVLFGKLRPYLAKVYLAEFDGVCSTEFLVFEAKANYDRGYISKLLLSDGFIKTVDASTYGSKMPRANPNFILNTLLPSPPIIEQLQIHEYITNISGATESAIINTVKQIQKIKEYKTTLINSAVTGKIKITPEMLQA